MPQAPTTIFLCSCEDGMPVQADAVRRVFPETRLEVVRHGCGADLERFRLAVDDEGTTLVACTAMEPLFRTVAAAEGLPATLRFADVREAAGWSSEAAMAGPKTAALLAAALETSDPPPSVTFESEGRILVIGRDGEALEAARRLQEAGDVSVVLRDLSGVVPLRRDRFALSAGRAVGVTGHLGAFRVAVEAHADAAPSSRAVPRAGLRQDRAVLEADIVVDLTSGPPLVPAPDLRPGYVRADPGDRAAVADALLSATGFIGTFDKPQYVAFHEGLCAHSRSRKTGCRRCLDVCPAGAIAPAGDHVAIDPHLCAGCGSCASVCPTGAAAAALPPVDALMRRLRAMMLAYRTAGGSAPVVLFHDEEHGADLIDALARFGAGLPADVLPVPVHAVTQVGPEQVAALFAYGASAVCMLLPARPRHDIAALRSAMTLMTPVLSALGYGATGFGLIETDDPDGLAASLADLERGTATDRPRSFQPGGPKRPVLDFALGELHAAAPTPVDVVPLAAGAPFGRVVVDTAGCTLCLACTTACPTGALGDNPDRPMLTFDESLCVQCGLCADTCPERVVTLEPRIRFSRPAVLRETIKEEDPAICPKCGKAFGTRATIDRVIAKLKGRHWMFDEPGRAELLLLCDTCRVGAVMKTTLDPHAGPERPRPKTSDDYIRARGERPER